MADKDQKYEDNVTGQWYVDKSCILCSLCTDLAPANFRESADGDHDYVYKQPANADEEDDAVGDVNEEQHDAVDERRVHAEQEDGDDQRAEIDQRADDQHVRPEHAPERQVAAPEPAEIPEEPLPRIFRPRGGRRTFGSRCDGRHPHAPLARRRRLRRRTGRTGAI